MPYSSDQIAQTIYGQQQAFMGMASASQQIGSAGGPPGVMPPTASFSTGTGQLSPYGYSMNAGGMATAATLGTAPSIMGGLSTMGMLGGMGIKPLKPFMAFDPFSMGFAARSAAGGGMAGAAAGLGVGMGMAGIGSAATYGLQQMYGGAMNFAQTGNIMQQQYGQTFRPQAMGMGGFGFSSQERKRMSGTIRSLSHVAELETDVGELQKIFSKMQSTGMMTGAISVDEIGRRFKEGIKTLRTLSRVMGTTMEEALPLFQESRQSGFFTSQDILKNAMQRQVVGGITGMSQQQLGQVAMQGANMVTQMGGSNRAAGAAGGVAQAGMISTAVRGGYISEAMLGAATGGQTGNEGIQALTGQVQQVGMQLAGTGAGTLIQAAAAEIDPETGKLTGRLDQNILSRAGSMSRGELRKLASKVTGNRGRRAQFATMQEEFSSQMAAAGPGAVAGVIKQAMAGLEKGGLSMEEAASHVLKSWTNASKPVRDIIVKMTTEGKAIADEARQSAFQQMNATVIREGYRTRTLGHRWDQFKRGLAKDIAQPFQRMGEDVAAGFGTMAEEMNQEWTGVSTQRISAGQASRFQEAFTAGGDELRRYQESAKGLTGDAWIGGNHGGGLTTGGSTGLTGEGMRFASGARRGGLSRMFGGQSAADRIQAAAMQTGQLTVLGVGDKRRAGVVTQVANVGGQEVFLGVDDNAIEKSWARMNEIRQGKVSVGGLLDRAEGKGMTGKGRARAGQILTSMGDKLRKLVLASGPEFATMDPQDVIKELEKAVGDEMGELRSLGVKAGFPEVYASLSRENNIGGLEGAPPPETMLEGVADAFGVTGGTPLEERKRQLLKGIGSALGSDAEDFAKDNMGLAAKLIRASGANTNKKSTAAYKKLEDILGSGKSWDEVTKSKADKAVLQSFGIGKDQFAGATNLVRGVARATGETGAGGLGRKTGLSEDNLVTLERIYDKQALDMAEKRGSMFAGQLGRIEKGGGSELTRALAIAERGGASGLRKGVMSGLSGLEEALRGGKGGFDLSKVGEASGGLMMQLARAMEGEGGEAMTDVLRELEGSGEGGLTVSVGARKAAGLLGTKSKADKTGIVSFKTMASEAGLSEAQMRKLAEQSGARMGGGGVVASDVDKVAQKVAEQVAAAGLLKEGVFAGMELKQNYEREFSKTIGKMGEAFNGMSLFVDVLNHTMPAWKDRMPELMKDYDEKRGAEMAGGKTG